MVRIFLSLLIILGLGLSPVPSFADDLDDECITYCTDNGFEDGHYLPPEPGAECDEDFEQDSANPICCCL